MFLFMNTSCQKGVQRASVRHGGVFGGADFNVLGNFAELVSEFESHADIAVFVNLDVVHKFNKNFPVECFIKAIREGCSLSTPFVSSARSEVSRASISERDAICRSQSAFISRQSCWVISLVFPLLIKGTFISGDFRQLPLLCGDQIVQSEIALMTSICHLQITLFVYSFSKSRV